jgi:hypothetical protein
MLPRPATSPWQVHRHTGPRLARVARHDLRPVSGLQSASHLPAHAKCAQWSIVKRAGTNSRCEGSAGFCLPLRGQHRLLRHEAIAPHPCFPFHLNA